MFEHYDKENNRLVFIKEKSIPAYWDSHWESDNFLENIITPANKFVLSNTMQYLPKGSKILEGGCGRGDKVFTLRKNGYDSYGVDFAVETVKKINLLLPELNIFLGDVRNLQFDDNYFDGYWSLGVIEHFYHGYKAILKEMHRVLRVDGFLFMTVPTMSWLREFKARNEYYSEYVESNELIDKFYQYAYHKNDIILDFEKYGFQLIKHTFRNSIKGLKDEIHFIKTPLQTIYDGKSLPANLLNKSIGYIAKFFASHTSFFVFKKI